MLFLYLLSIENYDYDDFDSCIVCATSEEDAKKIHPMGNIFPNGCVNGHLDVWNYGNSWALPENVLCKKIGIADKSIEENSVILASYNAS